MTLNKKEQDEICDEKKWLTEKRQDFYKTLSTEFGIEKDQNGLDTFCKFCDWFKSNIVKEVEVEVSAHYEGKATVCVSLSDVEYQQINYGKGIDDVMDFVDQYDLESQLVDELPDVDCFDFEEHQIESECVLLKLDPAVIKTELKEVA